MLLYIKFIDREFQVFSNICPSYIQCAPMVPQNEPVLSQVYQLQTLANQMTKLFSNCIFCLLAENASSSVDG